MKVLKVGVGNTGPLCLLLVRKCKYNLTTLSPSAYQGRLQQTGKSDSKGHSKLCGKDVEFHDCGKKNHFKRGCFKWKKKKEKGKKTNDNKEEMKES